VVVEEVLDEPWRYPVCAFVVKPKSLNHKTRTDKVRSDGDNGFCAKTLAAA
jgi:hypothetical protein